MRTTPLRIVTLALTLAISVAGVSLSQSTSNSQVSDLANTPAVASMLQAIEDQRAETRSVHIELTEIPAPPFQETARGLHFAEMVRQAGADSVWIDEVGNVLALLRGSEGERTVALNAHLDTVFPAETDVSVVVRGDTLLAPGISDDTRGVALIWRVLKTLVDHKVRGRHDILIAASVGEEGLGDLRGVKHLFRDNGPRIDSWIAVDGSGLTSIVHQGLGSHRYRVTIKGPGGHSWGAFGLANPHHAASRIVTHFVDSADGFTRSGPKTSYNIGRIGGGTSVNSIPFESWFEVDMRSESDESLAEVDSLLQRAVRKGLSEQNDLRRDGDAMVAEVVMIGNRPSGSIAETEELVQRAIAVTKHFDATPDLRRSSTDSNIPIAMGIPAVTIGHGGIGKGAHSLDEYWIDKDGYKGIQRALMLLLAEAGITLP